MNIGMNTMQPTALSFGVKKNHRGETPDQEVADALKDLGKGEVLKAIGKARPYDGKFHNHKGEVGHADD